jgi:hypothetical protein
MLSSSIENVLEVGSPKCAESKPRASPERRILNWRVPQSSSCGHLSGWEITTDVPKHTEFVFHHSESDKMRDIPSALQSSFSSLVSESDYSRFLLNKTSFCMYYACLLTDDNSSSAMKENFSSASIQMPYNCNATLLVFRQFVITGHICFNGI